IIHWNTIYTGRVVDALHTGGQHVPDHLLSSLSPLTWEHVNLTGDYIWEDKPALDETGFRPLPFSV
ncbi:Tn3 family transposase, partial [Agrobacterium salinitolerans]